MEGELEEHCEIADEKREIRINNRKEKSCCLPTYCVKISISISFHSGMDDFIKSFEINIYIYCKS